MGGYTIGYLYIYIIKYKDKYTLTLVCVIQLEEGKTTLSICRTGGLDQRFWRLQCFVLIGDVTNWWVRLDSLKVGPFSPLFHMVQKSPVHLVVDIDKCKRD